MRIRSPYPYGTHHTKLMIFIYDDDSVRVVVSTANLVPSDWENRTQGLWIGPKCPPGQGDSPTAFKSCLLRYLQSYQVSFPIYPCNAMLTFFTRFACLGITASRKHGGHKGRGFLESQCLFRGLVPWKPSRISSLSLWSYGCLVCAERAFKALQMAFDHAMFVHWELGAQS